LPRRPTLDSRPSAPRPGRVAAALRRRWVRWRHRGDAVECPCCGRRWAAFAADWNRPNAICPGCGSHERHRALWLYLDHCLHVGEADISLLHFAPEHALRGRLAALGRVRLTTADLEQEDVDVRADITALPFDDRAFDAILCSHVLEHVHDDRAAMRELRRVLRPGGWALVMVPLDLTRRETFEDDSITSPEERERAFLQDDHVRLYAPDLADRLSEAGFDVRAEPIAGVLPPGSVERHGLVKDDVVFRCTRPR
jgi:SAM-dependent methyltransferase